MKNFIRLFKRYLTIWYRLTINSFLISLSSRFSVGIFLIGKALRFMFMAYFLTILFSQNREQILFYYLTFNIIDSVSQLLFREVYRFRPLIVSGDFDLILVKPMSPLFRSLLGGADPLDLVMLVPFTVILFIVGLNISTSIYFWLIYLLMLGAGITISAAFHILVLSLAVLTTEVDHAVMIFRDVSGMVRIPVDFYQQPIRFVITFILPVGLMMSFPAQAFLGRLPIFWIFFTLIYASGFLVLCLQIWKYSLRKYSSASS